MPMQIHARERVVTEAKIKLMKAIGEAVEDLTLGESLSVVSQACNDYITTATKYMIRRERHRSNKKPGGIAG